jgi:hypothetical protein
MNGEVMNMVLFMMRQLNDLKMDKNQNLTYALYIMALILAKTRFEGRCEVAHTSFRPFKNEIAFLHRALTPFPDVEDAAGDDEEADPVADAAQQMPPPPPPPQQGQYWQPGPGYFDPYLHQIQQGLQHHMDSQYQGLMTHIDGRFQAMDTRMTALQTHVDGQYSAITSRLCNIDDQFDGVFSEFSELRTHIHNTVHDPIMNRMNSMQQSF